MPNPAEIQKSQTGFETSIFRVALSRVKTQNNAEYV